MFNYARSDTHFLLYIYDHLRNELLEKQDISTLGRSLIEEVLQRSKAEALQRYERPIYDAKSGKGASGWYNMLVRTPTLFNKEQFAVFRAVHQWRQQLARKEDENEHEIMPKYVIFNIAKQMPMDMPSLLGCSQPISATVHSGIGELLQIVKEAKIAGATGPEMMEMIDSLKPTNAGKQYEQNTVEKTRPSASLVSGKLLSPLQASHCSLSVKTHVSQFWGSTIEKDIFLRQTFEAQRQHQNIRLALPLPQLSAEVFEGTIAGGNFIEEMNQHEPGARVEHEYVRERKPKENNVFVIKQVGGSKKRKAEDLEGLPERGQVGAPSKIALTHGDDDDRELEAHVTEPKEDKEAQDQAEKLLLIQEHKRSRKGQRKARKREKGNQSNGTQNKGQRDEDEAFDYTNAPSVLHAKKEKNDQTGVRPSFDPYSKSLDAPKGMRHSKKEVGGRSFTFKK